MLGEGCRRGEASVCRSGGVPPPRIASPWRRRPAAEDCVASDFPTHPPWPAVRRRYEIGAIMSFNKIRVAVTGAAGQVAYAMLGRLASGEIFGPNTKVVLQ